MAKAGIEPGFSAARTDALPLGQLSGNAWGPRRGQVKRDVNFSAPGSKSLTLYLTGDCLPLSVSGGCTVSLCVSLCLDDSIQRVHVS